MAEMVEAEGQEAGVVLAGTPEMVALVVIGMRATQVMQALEVLVVVVAHLPLLQTLLLVMVAV